jgi:hypothetical protein
MSSAVAARPRSPARRTTEAASTWAASARLYRAPGCPAVGSAPAGISSSARGPRATWTSVLASKLPSSRPRLGAPDLETAFVASGSTSNVESYLVMSLRRVLDTNDVLPDVPDKAIGLIEEWEKTPTKKS